MAKTIDLNLDAGESLAALKDGSEEMLYRYITSVSIACGGHIGDEQSMNLSLDLAKKYGLKVGAHPSFPDTKNFGRVEMQIEPSVLLDSLKQQTLALKKICDEKNVNLTHLKPHGALYNLSARDSKLADVLIQVVKSVKPDLKVMMLAGSPAITWLNDAGIETVSEGFVDRRYENDGSLRSRKFPDALIQDPIEATRQAVQLVFNAPTLIQTLCIHGDSVHALSFAQNVRAGLEAANVIVK